MVRDPFEWVEPAPVLDMMEVLPRIMRRRAMWDMVGPAVGKTPDKYGESPASPDVLDLEYQDLMARRQALSVLGLPLDVACYSATEAATSTYLLIEPGIVNTPEDKMKFFAQNLKICEAVTKSVIGQLLTDGILIAGGN